MPGVVVGAFFLECSAQSYQLCSVESPSNDLVRFEQLIIHDTKLIPSNTCFFFHEYSAWLSMLKHGQEVPSSLDYRSGSIFHHQWLWCKKLFRLYLVSSISHVKNRSMFLGFSSYGTQFPCFWIIPNDFKRYEIVWVTPNVSASSFCIWYESSSNNASNSASSYIFGLPLRSLSSTSNSPFLNFWNHSRQLLSLKAASPYASTSNLWAAGADFFKLKK